MVAITGIIPVAGNWIDLGEPDKMRPARMHTGGFFIFVRALADMGNLDKQLDTFFRAKPKLGQNVYIAKSGVVLGDVTLGDNSSVWYNAVLRGDINRIVVGKGTNIQDNAVLHLADNFECVLGDYVTVGHSAIVHACTIG